MDSLIHGHLDIYAELGVASDAAASEIRRAFRKKALQYHPDKNPSPEAAEKFQLYSAIQSVLTSTSLRRQYDELRKISSDLPNAASREKILRFREQLRQQEARAQSERKPKKNTQALVEALSMKGIALRRQMQRSLGRAPAHISYRDLPMAGYTDAFLQRANAVLVSWKARDEAAAQISDTTLRELMEIFGPVSTAQVLQRDERYVRGRVVFATSQGFHRCLAHNFRQPANLWNGTAVRKLASLLREAEEDRSDGDEERDHQSAYVEQILAKAQQKLGTAAM